MEEYVSVDSRNLENYAKSLEKYAADIESGKIAKVEQDIPARLRMIARNLKAQSEKAPIRGVTSIKAKIRYHDKEAEKATGTDAVFLKGMKQGLSWVINTQKQQK